VTALEPRMKLIEVALPLDEINAACKADKDRKTGTVRNLHKWFAPMPLPAWRALLFASLVDDPGDDKERAALFDIIKRLVVNGAGLPDDSITQEARQIINAQFPNGLPTVMDPFCGGGSTLIEAQRLGLPTFASDLNPVPTLVSRVLTNIMPQAASWVAVTNPSAIPEHADVEGILPGFSASDTRGPFIGFTSDVRHHGRLLRDRVDARLKDQYPREEGETPIAWLWARTASCPNPACGIQTVLTTSWWLSKKLDSRAWLVPSVVDGAVELDVVSDQTVGEAPASPKVGRGPSFDCLACGQVLDERTLIEQGAAKRLGLRMTAVVVEKNGRRLYRAPTASDMGAAQAAVPPEGVADLPLPDIPRWFSAPRFGYQRQADLYTPRQLLLLATLAEEVAALGDELMADGYAADWVSAICTFLGLSVGKLASYSSTLCSWRMRTTRHGKAESAFGRNDVPMMWDFPETYWCSNFVGDWLNTLESMLSVLPLLPIGGTGRVVKADARTVSPGQLCLVATDPPYFDAIGYADLSDYFYIWHRLALRTLQPDLYATAATPKVGELTAVPSHHGNSKEAARDYFIDGFTETFRNLQSSMSPEFPMLVVYASKEQKGGRDEETRWSSILTAMVQAELQIVGTWPIHGTGSSRMIGQGTNSVATYVVMVCRPRLKTAGTCSLADFNRSLRRELRPAVHNFQAAGILPVDLAQAAMGPGMQVYSRYRQVLDQAGTRVPVEQALRLINAALGEVLDEQEGELDSYSRFAVAWWEKHGWNPAAFGQADQMARPQGLSVDDLVRAAVARYPRPGFVELVGSQSMDRGWTPASDTHPTAWEAVHHLADRLIDGGGTKEAGRLMNELGAFRDPSQALVYRLHDIAARKGRVKDQERYNALIGSWSDLLAISAVEQEGLF